MSTSIHSAKLLRKRQFLLMLPLIIFPFLTLFFWALGGGSDAEAAQTSTAQKGFNMELPAPVLGGDSTWNKMNFYQKADADSARIKKLMKADPYYQLPLTDVDTGEYLSPAGKSPHHFSAQRNHEQEVYEKLAALDKQLKVPETATREQPSSSFAGSTGEQHLPITHDVAKLDEMMQAMRAPRPTDPEMEQLKDMMETLRDIQHPEMVEQKLKKQSAAQKGEVFPVQISPELTPVTLLGNEHDKDTSAFYGLGDKTDLVQAEKPAIRAFIANNQTITQGSTVKLQLSQDIFINGINIPTGQFIYGQAQTSQERLMIEISSVRYTDFILPVALSVYDLDGLQGIFIPGSISRDVTKQSADQRLQSLNMLSLDPSLGGQAALAGIETAKKLISRKVKQVKIKLVAGYQVLLRDIK